MKHAIIIALLATAAHGQWVISQTNIVDGSWSVTSTHPILTVPKGVSDQVVSNLIANGTVCRVRGKHEWRFKDIWGDYQMLDVWNQSSRKCDLCWRKEIKQEVWKEDGQ